MPLRVVGAGLGRTGTNSLKVALERLLGGPCYHMFEVFEHQDHIPVWQAAVRGEMPRWNEFLSGYTATVDWPAVAFWRELAAANPDALVLLSVRDVDAWWRSVSSTIFSPELRTRTDRTAEDWPWDLITARFTPRWQEEDAAKAAYVTHNDEVRRSVAPGRLLEWRPEDGWEPICRALRVAVPDEPFPHLNTTADFRARLEEQAATS